MKIFASLETIEVNSVSAPEINSDGGGQLQVSSENRDYLYGLKIDPRIFCQRLDLSSIQGNPSFDSRYVHTSNARIFAVISFVFEIRPDTLPFMLTDIHTIPSFHLCFRDVVR